MLNPYQSPPISTPAKNLRGEQRSYVTLILFTSFQIFAILTAHRIWMESPANQYVLFGQSWIEKVLSSIFYSLVFVFVNCTLAWTSDRFSSHRFSSHRAESRTASPTNSPTNSPSASVKNCEKLTILLAACFAVCGLSMTVYHRTLHPITSFMVVAAFLTLLSAAWYRFELARTQAKNPEVELGEHH